MDILNELVFEKNGLGSKLISMNKLMFYVATSTSAVKVTVEISALGLTLDMLLQDTGATYTYWFLDVTGILKYKAVSDFKIKTKFTFNDEYDTVNYQGDNSLALLDGGGYTDVADQKTSFVSDINIIAYNSSEAQIDSYYVEDAILTIQSNRQGDFGGFNMWDVYNMQSPVYLKWSNDTMNIIGSVASQGITNMTNDDFPVPGEPIGFGFRKVSKRIRDVYVRSSKNWQASSNNPYYPESTMPPPLTVFTTGKPGAIASVKVSFKWLVHDIDTTTDSRVVIDSEIIRPKVKGKIAEYSKKIDYSAAPVANSTLQFLTDSPLTGVLTQSFFDIRFEVEFTEDYSGYILKPGENVFQLLKTDSSVTGTVIVEHEPYGCYNELLWFHHKYGWVSYPFEGALVDSVEISSEDFFNVAGTTLLDGSDIGINNGNTNTGVAELTTKADKKYFPLLKGIYGTHCAYLYIGKKGDDNWASNWLRVKVDGSYSLNDRLNPDTGIFTVKLSKYTDENLKV